MDITMDLTAGTWLPNLPSMPALPHVRVRITRTHLARAAYGLLVVAVGFYVFEALAVLGVYDWF